MHFRQINVFLLVLLILSACDFRTNDVSLAAGIPSATPFQPLDGSASDSPYEAAAPTPPGLPSVTPAPAPTQINIQPEVLPADVTVPEFVMPGSLNPLTGLPPYDPSYLDRRPLAVKVANYPRYVRPQMGLTLADHVFEYYIEGGLTRFIAVFYGNNSEWVGPVRSGRFFDENVQRMYQAFLVFKFADPRVLDHFKLSDFSRFIVVPTTGRCPPFRLLPTRQIEDYNNSYFYTPGWDECIDHHDLNNDRPILRASFYNDLVPLSEHEGKLIRTFYSSDSYNYWQYIPETHEYARYQEVDDIRNDNPERYEPMMDAATATAVHAANVVVLLASHTFANTFDEEDEVYHIDLTRSGEAYVFRDGMAIMARWHRTNKDQPLLLTGANGALIYMRPGITFYQVIGSHSLVNQDAGEWHFQHDTP